MTPNAFGGDLGSGDLYVARFNQPATNVEHATYIGGSETEEIGGGLVVDSDGFTYIVGTTESPTLPQSSDTVFTRQQGGKDVFTTILDPAGAILYSVYLGGRGDDYGNAIASDSGRVFLTGTTWSDNFPVTESSTSSSALPDAFLTLMKETTILFSARFPASGMSTDHGYDIALVSG